MSTSTEKIQNFLTECQADHNDPKALAANIGSLVNVSSHEEQPIEGKQTYGENMKDGHNEESVCIPAASPNCRIATDNAQCGPQATRHCKPRPIGPLTEVFIERFQSYVDRSKPQSCWLWTKSVSRDGYGQIRVGLNVMRTNRIAFYIAYGVDPGDLDVLHKCDNPRCCRPDHLFLGTASDNLKDAIQKGRLNMRLPKNNGARNGRAKLTDQLAWEIRCSVGPAKDVAKQYGVSLPHVYGIRSGKTWKDVIAPPQETVGENQPSPAAVQAGTTVAVRQSEPSYSTSA